VRSDLDQIKTFMNLGRLRSKRCT